MPFDQRRINGPEETTPYSIYVDLNAKPVKSSIKSELETRADSRKHTDFRQMCKFNQIRASLSFLSMTIQLSSRFSHKTGNRQPS